ncbi:DUF5348 domain-containing protein [Cohnella massiliensis]|uniref:DUF5348 domain-containing protein n=1 Tax=Cohnella massiliensis TaxID=1816691 RepID=UPI0009BA8C76|nr:DUF5348 domain-containing protein [Cohnella massiliensis]
MGDAGRNSSFYTVSDLYRLLPLGKNAIYKLVNQEDFPKIKFGRKVIIPRDWFDEWVRSTVLKNHSTEEGHKLNMKEKHTIMFDKDRQRWFVIDEGYGLHCGECFSLYIGDKPVLCRLEFDSDWYVIMDGVRFYLRTQDKYLIAI